MILLWVTHWRPFNYLPRMEGITFYEKLEGQIVGTRLTVE